MFRFMATSDSRYDTLKSTTAGLPQTYNIQHPMFQIFQLSELIFLWVFSADGQLYDTLRARSLTLLSTRFGFSPVPVSLLIVLGIENVYYTFIILAGQKRLLCSLNVAWYIVFPRFWIEFTACKSIRNLYSTYYDTTNNTYLRMHYSCMSATACIKLCKNF
jgi:hypothetical protein